MAPDGQPARTLHVHPTRRCNLRCLHCYSSSGPEERASLDIGVLRRAVRDAADMGYRVLSVSGGEPLVYGSLPELLDAAHDAGMATTLTTNGMLLGGSRGAALRGRADLVAVSLDGAPARHNHLRASEKAFDGLCEGLEHLRSAGIPFGILFTLTSDSIDDVPFVARFAAEQGARLLQLHPLEEVGRARSLLRGAEPGAETLAFAWMLATALRAAYDGKLTIQLDVVDTEVLRDNACSSLTCEGAGDALLAQLVSPLCITEEGLVLPIQHDFPRASALGSLHDAPLSELAAAWRRDLWPAFAEVSRTTFAEITAPTDLPFASYYAELGKRAQRAAWSRRSLASLAA